MPFQKGHKLAKGRPKGSTNKDNEIKRAIKEGISIDELIIEINSLPEKRDKIDRLIKLLEFAWPKMKATEHSGEIKVDKIIELIEADEETEDSDPLS